MHQFISRKQQNYLIKCINNFYKKMNFKVELIDLRSRYKEEKKDIIKILDKTLKRKLF